MKTLIIALICSFVLFSCSNTKEKQELQKESFKYEVSIKSLQVAEQINVSHYVLQVSTNGNDFEDVGVVFADTNTEGDYKGFKFDVSKYLISHNKIHVRWKYVDTDTKFGFSNSVTLHK